MEALIIFFTGMGGGAIFEVLLSFTEELFDGKPLRINHRFTLTKRVSMITLPLWGLLALFITGNYTHAYLFLVSAVL